MEMIGGIVDKGGVKLPDLPILGALPALLSALKAQRVAVLQAPPGAGKTTVVPLAILDAGLVKGRILMLEPRRLAARAAAERMAESLGEPVGRQVGYRMRGEAVVSPQTRIEVVTEGILTRMIQSDPSLAGVGAVIFDEFHERSLNADLGLALTWEIRNALREELVVLVMSATLDAVPVAEMLQAPVITSQGQAFTVETHWLERPVDPVKRLEDAAADLIETAIRANEGGVLVFLPGEGEIRRVASLLGSRLPQDCKLHPLFGAMPFAAQRAAIAPAATGRKIVLATSIAETSLTIQDIRVVVDAGRARRARFDPGSGMSRLVTERVSRAEADQRQGRAGRVAPGVCYRMWTRGEEGGMLAFPPAEIEVADLTGLVLELALWGARDGDDLAFLTPPNPGAFAAARDLLRDLGALDGSGAITPHGRKMAQVPAHPRLAHMILTGGRGAGDLAALLEDRDPIGRGAVDLSLRREAMSDTARFARERGLSVNRAALERIRAQAKRLRKFEKGRDGRDWSELAAIAYPDRIGLRRAGEAPRWVLSGGKGARIDAADPLAGARLIVATNLDGDALEARVRQAIEISEASLRELYGEQIKWREICKWSKRERRVVARRQEYFGALVLADQIWCDAQDEALALAALDGVRHLGMHFSPAADRLRARVALALRNGADLPDMSDAALLDGLEGWLQPYLGGVKTEAQLRGLDLLAPLRAMLDWQQVQLLDKQVPGHFTTPMGRQVAIDYALEVPEISVRLQEMFGVTAHPRVGGQPLRVTLLSPARRPVQTTTDLVNFWATSYGDVRKDMRGRYPKHPWPEDPTIAEPTLRAKPRSR